ncbi:MAG TPA: hypothetical protein VNI02_06900 [Blastocatellia bacterium]|nr:hypothetical protein [Blastocatellia bacterium]
MISKYFKILSIILTLILTSTSVLGQSKKKSTRKPQNSLERQFKESKANLINAAKNNRESLEKLLVLEEDEVKRANAEVEKIKALPSNIVAKTEIEKKEHVVATAQAKVNETRKKIAEVDTLIAEVRAEEQLAKLPPPRVGGYQTTAALIRYNGPSRWALADASKVQSFFLSRFRRSLPISAFGQTEVHNRLGFDHSNSIDVAVHPDNAEGQALMAYLRSAGIPFIAFRQAVAGSATGAHIHIGYPSHRIGR